MKFEYNGNLLEEDRINLVAKEILDKYPQISTEKAIDAALLEGRISSAKTLDVELNRLYNIMLVNYDNKNIVTLVYRDFLKILDDEYIEDDNIYAHLVDGINDYIHLNAEFPFLSDYQ